MPLNLDKLRPFVAFDVNNKLHRKYYYNFVKDNGWKNCPVRFFVPNEATQNLVALIQKELVKHYVSKEFNGH